MSTHVGPDDVLATPWPARRSTSVGTTALDRP